MKSDLLNVLVEHYLVIVIIIVAFSIFLYVWEKSHSKKVDMETDKKMQKDE